MIPQEAIERWSERTRARAQKWLRAQLDKYSLSKDQPLLAICEHFESFRSTWYRCTSGTRTIGYGYTGPADTVRPAPWNEEYAREILHLQLRGEYRQEAQSALARCGIDLETLPPQQQYAIISLVHNGGPKAIWTQADGPRTWVRRWIAKAPRAEIEEAYYRFNRSGGEISPGLVRRRFSEMRLFWDGIIDFYPEGWREYYRANGGR